MGAYLLKRILLFFPTLLGVICVNFALIQILPGGPLEQSLSDAFLGRKVEGERVSEWGLSFKKESYDRDSMEALKKHYDFDKPFWQRFLKEIYRLLSFDFGDSYFFHKSVLELIKEKLPVSLILGFLVFFLTYAISIPLGVMRALLSGSFLESIIGSLCVFLHSIPTFALGVLLIVLLGGGSFWQIFPIKGLVSEHFSDLSFWEKVKDFLHHLCLPALCLSSGTLVFMSTLTKNSILDQSKLEYVRMARLKGVSERSIVMKHILRNAALPLVAGFGIQFLGIFLSSGLLIETVFSLDGMGLLFYESIVHRDYPLVMANVYLLSCLLITVNLITDLVYVLLDPRVDLFAEESPIERKVL